MKYGQSFWPLNEKRQNKPSMTCKTVFRKFFFPIMSEEGGMRQEAELKAINRDMWEDNLESLLNSIHVNYKELEIAVLLFFFFFFN